MITKIKELEQMFNDYIDLLKMFDSVEKAEMGDYYNLEEQLRQDIESQLNKLKEFF